MIVTKKMADDQTERLENSLRHISSQVDELLALARQYRDDMRHPPAQDSRGRRIEWINRVIGKDHD